MSGCVESYDKVCRDLGLNEDHRRRLEIAKEIERVEERLDDPATATDEQILTVCDDLHVSTFRALGESISREGQGG